MVIYSRKTKSLLVVFLVFCSLGPAEPHIWQVVHEWWTHPAVYSSFKWTAVSRNASQTVSFSSLEAWGKGSEWGDQLPIPCTLGRGVRPDSRSPIQNLRRTAPVPVHSGPSWFSGRIHSSLGILGSTGRSCASLPGQGQPEFSRPRTILGNTPGEQQTCLFSSSTACSAYLRYLPFFSRNHSPGRNVPWGFGKFFPLSKWGLALGICEISSKESISLRPTNSLFKVKWEQRVKGAFLKARQ